MATVEDTLEKLTGPLGAVKEGFDALSGKTQQLQASINGLIGSVTVYTSKVDPGQTELLSQAFDDLYAAVGSGLTPIIDALIPILDMANQAVTSFMEAVRPAVAILSQVVRDALAPFFASFQRWANQWGDVISKLVTAMLPLATALNEMIDIFTEFDKAAAGAFADLLQTVVPVLVDIFRALANVTVAVVRALRQFLGLPTVAGAPAAPEGGITHAARPAHFDTIEGVGRAAQLTAFGGRSSDLPSALDRNTAALGELHPVFQDLMDTVETWWGVIEDAWKDLSDVVEDWMRAIEGAWNNLSAAFENVRQRIASLITALANLPQEILDKLSTLTLNVGQGAQQAVQNTGNILLRPWEVFR